MEENNNKKIVAIVLAVLAVALIAGGFYYSYRANHKTEVFNPALESTRGEETTAQTIDVKHQFKNGIHTFAGEISLPTPCDLVEAEAQKNATEANKISLVFTSTNTTEVCKQIVSARRWKTSITMSKDATVSGTLNGSPLILNIFEVPEGENLDTFEIDIKG
ncbi:MAG: hypothetical protein ABI430_01890 [Candidatus Taylorbacteria bacterium]